MEIENKRGILDLSHDTTLEIERTNPLFNEQGSYSLPFNIKITPHNNFILGYPALYERKDVFENKQAVNIRTGVLNENATLEIFNTTDAIEGTIYLFETSFYNQIKEIKLSQVFDGVERWFQSEDVDRNDRIMYIVDMLENMILSDTEDNEDFTIFPAVIDCQFLLSLSYPLGRPLSQASPENFLNELFVSYDTGSMEYRLKGRNKRTYKDSDGTEITLPVGYSITPFLKLKYVLRKIFEYFGLTLETSILDTSPKYKNIIVLNNTADAILPGYFIESQLVPDCTVNDLLDVIRKSFCADFFIDVNEKKARLILFNEVTSMPPDLDLTAYLTSDFEKVEINQPKHVKLTVNKSLPYASTIADTLTDFSKKYSSHFDDPSLTPTQEGFYPYFKQNSIWKLYTLNGTPDSFYKTERISSMNFDYCTDEELETEEHSIPMESPATVYITHNYSYGLFTYAPVIGSKRNLNSFVIVNGKQEEEEKATCPIVFSLGCFEEFCRIGVQTTSNRSFGEQLQTDPIQSSLLLWDDNGLFAKHWKNYDDLLRTSFHQITYKLRLPAYLIKEFRFDRLKIIKGQPLFTVSMKYQMLDQDFIEVEILFKTVKIYDQT